MTPETRPSTTDRFDDDDYPAYTMGRAAEMIGTTPAFLRAIGDARLITPLRSEGGHRRYSRYQLRIAARARELVDPGTPIDAACRIVILEDQLEEALRLNEELRQDTGQPARTEPCPGRRRGRAPHFAPVEYLLPQEQKSVGRGVRIAGITGAARSATSLSRSRRATCRSQLQLWFPRLQVPHRRHTPAAHFSISGALSGWGNHRGDAGTAQCGCPALPLKEILTWLLAP